MVIWGCAVTKKRFTLSFSLFFFKLKPTLVSISSPQAPTELLAVLTKMNNQSWCIDFNHFCGVELVFLCGVIKWMCLPLCAINTMCLFVQFPPCSAPFCIIIRRNNNNTCDSCTAPVTDLICRSCHCAPLLHGQPEAVAETTRSSTHLSPGCRIPRWRGSPPRSCHQSRTGAYPGDRQRSWLSWGGRINQTTSLNRWWESLLLFFSFFQLLSKVQIILKKTKKTS